MTKLIIGCGYLGRRVAAAWLADGCRVFAVTRSAAKANELKTAGIRPIIADVTVHASLPRLPAVDTVLHSLGFDRSKRQSIQQVFECGLDNVLRWLDPASLRRFFYISSTGVFGQRDGEWVDERSACQPMRSGGQACLAAEKSLGSHPLADRVTVLRLAGLYGPGRIPRRRELVDGVAMDVPIDGFLNLIHVEDVVRVILALERQDTRPDLMLVSDGSPVRRIDYYRELARLLNAPAPRFRTPDADLPAFQRAAGSDKRVSNRRMLEALDMELLYPSYREGLAAIVRAEGQAGS